ncbi:hypothetical protein [Agromyces aureus]|uniref:Uncharacterized protein n=1 Tax=Agromyces aureus TaxID=453304 RepID=A0A191WEV9_9MICO|nr:hypothetical protein [Agromyces aureus]ANJ26815.1 hypothetical protein ATC03_08885 [Agromyces aureus]
MGAPLADPARLGSWLGLGPLDGDNLTRATEVIGTISDLVRGEARQNDWTLETVPANIAAIVLMVSVECWVNPDNKTSVTIEEITRRWEQGDLFSASQLATIRSCRPGQSSGLSTIGTTRGYHSPTVQLSAVEGGNPVRLYDGRGY